MGELALAYRKGSTLKDCFLLNIGLLVLVAARDENGALRKFFFKSSYLHIERCKNKLPNMNNS